MQNPSASNLAVWRRLPPQSRLSPAGGTRRGTGPTPGASPRPSSAGTGRRRGWPCRKAVASARSSATRAARSSSAVAARHLALRVGRRKAGGCPGAGLPAAATSACSLPACCPWPGPPPAPSSAPAQETVASRYRGSVARKPRKRRRPTGCCWHRLWESGWAAPGGAGSARLRRRRRSSRRSPSPPLPACR